MKISYDQNIDAVVIFTIVHMILTYIAIVLSKYHKNQHPERSFDLDRVCIYICQPQTVLKSKKF